MNSKEKKAAVKNIPIDYIIEDLGIQIKHVGKTKKIVCPYHNEKTPSAVIGDRNVVHCFGCGAKADAIELTQHIRGMSYPEALDYLYNAYVLGGVRDSLPRRAAATQEPEKDPAEKYREMLANFRPYSSRMRPGKKSLIKGHLEERGLYNAEKWLKMNGYEIGVITIGIHANIAYKFKNHIVVRYPDNKANYGRPTLSNLIIDPDNKTIMICEGITDALAAAEMGFNSIILHSINNLDRLIGRFSSSEKAKEFDYIIGTDNDKGGLQARDRLINYFKANDFNFKDYEPLRASGVKDLGELYLSEVKLHS